MKRIKNAVVAAGKYKKGGEEKTKWLTVGALMEDDGKQFVFLDKTFNPAGVSDDFDSVRINFFDIDKKSVTEAPPADDFGDSIPF